MQPGCERLHNVWRTHPQPPNPQSETGTLATHSGRTFDSLPLVHRGKFMRKNGTIGKTMFGQRHPKIFCLQILHWTQGVREPCKLGAMHSRGSLGRGSICDSGISASEAALAGGVGELSEPLAANRLQFMSTYFYMWSLMQWIWQFCWWR